MRRLATGRLHRAFLAAPSTRPCVLHFVRQPHIGNTRLLSTSLAPQSMLQPGPTSNLPVQTDLLQVYRSLVSTGRLSWDDEQVRVVMRLRHLIKELEQYEPPLDLLAKLGPTPPRQLTQSWWRPGARRAARAAGVGLGNSEREHALVKVLSGEEEIASLTTPQGILLTGPPGSGKSLMLSLAFNALPTPHKARHHYHAFTLGIYQRVFNEMERRRAATPLGAAQRNKELAGARGWRAVFAAGRWKEGADVDLAETQTGYDDPRDTIPFVIAKEMILEYHILYFDELQLLDASSAALLRDVLSWYWRLGGVILACSNRVPDDLYHHGVQKERMAGFLDALKARCETVELDGGRDWRRKDDDRPPEVSPWLALGDTSFETAWTGLDAQETSRELVVYGRRVPVPATKGDAARFPFADLCETPLGPADYITLASTFETFYIDDIPVLLLKHKNEARRLINLIDALYESKCKIVARAAARPEHLFFPDALDPTLDPEHHGLQDRHDSMLAESLSESLGAQPRANVSLYNPRTREQREMQDRADLGSSFAVSSIFTGEDERFAYKRAVSRLIEMTTSPAYAAEPWTPLGAGARGWEAHDGSEPTSAAQRSSPHVDMRFGLSQGDDAFARESGAAGAELAAPPEPVARPDVAKAEESAEKNARDSNDGVTPGPREGAPRIADVHAWGVEERWGKKAGRWGRGASAFEDGNGRPGVDEDEHDTPKRGK